MQNYPSGISSIAMEALTMAKQIADQHAAANTSEYKTAVKRRLLQHGIDHDLAAAIAFWISA